MEHFEMTLSDLVMFCTPDNDNDPGVLARVFNTALLWMQE